MGDKTRTRLGYISADGVVGASPQEPFYQPTVLADITDDNPAAACEAFGPMASVMSYSDADEALARANATEFGLSAQVWGATTRRRSNTSFRNWWPAPCG